MQGFARYFRIYQVIPKEKYGIKRLTTVYKCISNKKKQSKRFSLGMPERAFLLALPPCATMDTCTWMLTVDS